MKRVFIKELKNFLTKGLTLTIIIPKYIYFPSLYKVRDLQNEVGGFSSSDPEMVVVSFVREGG